MQPCRKANTMRKPLSVQEQHRPSPILIALVVLSPLEALAVLPMLFAALMGFMVFDAPGSAKMPMVWATFVGLWALPALVLALNVVAWILFACRKHRTALAAVVLAGSIQAAAYIAFACWLLGA